MSMTRTRRTRGWLQSHVGDAYVKQARQAGYRSRAAYKLIELDERDHVLKPGLTVLDLGAAPGGWSQVAARKVTPGGRVIAVDLLPMASLSGVEIIRGDFSDAHVRDRLRAMGGRHGIDLVISDLSPNITGRRDVDRANTLCLNELTLGFAGQVLNKGGNLVIKTFHGEGFDEWVEQARAAFAKVAVRKPKASRSYSAEVYLVARGLGD